MAICNPYIKKAENLKWLEENEELFLDYMAKHHSLYDVCHTILHIDSLNDQYVENMIKNIKAATRKKLNEEKKIQKAVEDEQKNKPVQKSAIETKNEKIEKAVEAKKKAKQEDDDLLD